MSSIRMRKGLAQNWSSWAVYDGRTLVGTINRVGKKFQARDAKGRVLGRFCSAKQALAVIT
jgi:hypothetical protein